MSKYVGRIITHQAPAGYSVYFDGTGDYLSNTANTIIPTTGDFTFETWVYPTQVSTLQFLIGTTNNSGNKFFIYISSTAYVGVQTGSSYRDSSTTKVVANAWNHIACTRTGSTYALFVNGVSQSISGVGTMASTLDVTPTYIGSRDAGNSPVTGYLSNVRVCNSVLYTAAFTPPTQLLNITGTSLLTCNSPAIVDQSSNAFAITTNGNAAVSTFTPFAAYNPYNPALGASTPGVWTLDEAMQAAATRQWNMYDPYFQNTTLLLHGNGTNGAQNNTFLDSSSNNFTITRNGNTTQGSFSPFSQTGWSNYFDGTGDALTTNTTNSGWQLGTGDFEIAFWIYPESVTGNRDIFTQRNASGTPQIFLVNNVLRYNNALIAGILDATITIALNKWQYCVLSRVSGTTRWFIDGVAAGSVADTNNWSSTNSWWVSSTAQSFQGYISNLRLVKGAGVTSSTVPTAPLTAISGTTFLSCQSNRFIDSSSNGFQLTTNGNVSVQAFSPFYPTAAYTPATIGGGGYGGAGVGYLLAPASSNFQYPGDFSIETWVYVTTGDAGPIWGTAGGGGADQIYLAGSGSIFYGGSPSFPYFNSASSVVPYAWSHICITRQSGTLRVMINGILLGSRSSATTIGSATTGPGIFIRASLDDQINGPVYMADLRVCKGSVPTSYQTASTTAGTVIFTPPTQAITTTSQGATPANVSLLLNFTNAGIVDSTAKNDLETVGNAQISTTQSKFGGSSIYMAAATANTDYLVQPASRNIEFGTGNFTVEFWMWPTSITTNWSTGNYATILDADTAAGASTTDWWIIHQLDGAVVFASNNAIVLTSSSALTASTWQHVALVRNGSGTNNLTFYVNGTSVGSATYTAAVGGNRKLFVGTQSGQTRWYKGYIDDLRITKGIARYTANFTPQTSQWQDQ